VAIVFPIVTSYNDKGTKKADDAFTKLGKKFLAVFSVTKVVQFGKASVQAFSDSTKEAQLLATQLNAVNLGFASPFINNFIDKLELATGVAGDKLTNAFISLSQATGDASTAQKILTTALDVSLGTGKDLQTVSNALQRAYKGETTALARLRIGYTTAELKGKKFDEVLEDLQTRFDGAAGKATDTFAGKMQRLAAAVEQAKEAFGEGLVSGLEDADVSIEELQEGIINLGKALGTLSAAVVEFGKDAEDTFRGIIDSPAAKAVMALFEGLVRGAGFIVTGELVPTMDSASARLAGQQARKEAEQNRARLRAQNALTKAEKRTAIEKLNNEKKITSEKKKQNIESKIIDEINKRFEMDRIQIAAALGGQINDVERLRLELMQAILDEDVKRAIILEGQLIKAEAAAAELALLLDSLDEMVGDPFADWPGTITRIQELLKTLKIKIPIETLFAEKGLKLDQEKMTVTKLDRMDVNANNVYINGLINGQVANQNTGMTSTGWPEDKEKPGTLAHAVAVAIRAEAVADNAEALLAESEAALAAAEAAAALAAIENEANAAALATLFGKLGLDSEGNPITINVNVEGNVISAEDLAETITDIQYTYQKTGKGLLFSSIAI
jgi:hypothetical protein